MMNAEAEKIYHAAVYLRLSRDDHDLGAVRDGSGREKTESGSIVSQREYIRAFLTEQKNIFIYDTYVDDGYSGTNLIGVR